MGKGARGYGKHGHNNFSRQGRKGRGNANDKIDFRAPGYNDSTIQRIDEAQVGIQRFLHPNAIGFYGSVKERYSDFIVREITLNGDIVRLTDVKRGAPGINKLQKKLNINEIFKQRVYAFLNEAAHGDSSSRMSIPPIIHTLVGKLAGRLLGMLNQRKREKIANEQLKKIHKLTEQVAEICDSNTAIQLQTYLEQRSAEQNKLAPSHSFKDLEKDYYFPEIQDKDARAIIHKGLRDIGNDLVVSDTVMKENGDDAHVSVIRVRPLSLSGHKRKGIDNRSNPNRLRNGDLNGNSNKFSWPIDRPDYLQFVLYKKNAETNSVLAQIAKAMRCKVSDFTYAGTKDKRGITSQRITMYRGDINQLNNVNSNDRALEEFNFIVGNAKYTNQKLNLGDLQGNEFSIVIRGLPPSTELSDEAIEEKIQIWRNKGFLNYFGLQRFGTKLIPTWQVGRAILQRNYKDAINMLLDPQKGDATSIAEVKAKFKETGNADEALHGLPPYLIAERAVLMSLSRSHEKGTETEGYQEAIQSIPRHLRMMYTHSYQSYIWNQVASIRMDKENFPCDTPVVGDLVIKSTLNSNDMKLDFNDEEKFTEDEPDLKKRKTDSHKTQSRAEMVTVITPENLHEYSIEDVVLPLPGYDIKYPENEVIKGVYSDLLKQDDVNFDALKRATNSEYHLPGSYRHIIRIPKCVSHSLTTYSDNSPLLATDIDFIHMRATLKDDVIHKNRSIVIDHEPGNLRALCLKFQLGSSSYATMAIRELMKQSSSVEYQMKYNTASSVEK